MKLMNERMSKHEKKSDLQKMIKSDYNSIYLNIQKFFDNLNLNISFYGKQRRALQHSCHQQDVC